MLRPYLRMRPAVWVQTRLFEDKSISISILRIKTRSCNPAILLLPRSHLFTYHSLDPLPNLRGREYQTDSCDMLAVRCGNRRAFVRCGSWMRRQMMIATRLARMMDTCSSVCWRWSPCVCRGRMSISSAVRNFASRMCALKVGAGRTETLVLNW